MNKKLLAVSLGLMLVVTASPVSAENDTSVTPTVFKKRIFNNIREIKKDIREIRNDKRELMQDLRELKKDFKGKGIKIIDGIVTAKNAPSLTVTKDGKTYTVNTDSNTRFRRHFWGNSSFDEIAVNNNVNVWGKFTDDTQTTILAAMIRDLSIQKRRGVFVGTISNLNGTAFTLNSLNRSSQAVTLDGSTKCVDRKEETINCSNDLKNDHKVRVKGMWDKTNNTITEVTHVKDYSLPPKPTITPTSVPTPTPTQ